MLADILSNFFLRQHVVDYSKPRQHVGQHMLVSDVGQHVGVVCGRLNMLIARQLAKAKEIGAKRLRNEISDVSNVATASNIVQAPKDPIQGISRC